MPVMSTGQATVLPRTLALLLICATHFSICSGGLLSTAAALAASLPAEGGQQMTPVSPEDFVCVSATPAENHHAPASPCGADGNCIRVPVISDHRPDAVLTVVQVPAGWAEPERHDALHDHGTPQRVLAFDRVFPARYHVSTLAKRE